MRSSLRPTSHPEKPKVLPLLVKKAARRGGLIRNLETFENLKPKLLVPRNCLLHLLFFPRRRSDSAILRIAQRSQWNESVLRYNRLLLQDDLAVQSRHPSVVSRIV